MCDEISPKQTFKTLSEMEAEQDKIAVRFAQDLKRLKDAGLTLRQIADMKQTNYERVRQFLKLVDEP